MSSTATLATDGSVLESEDLRQMIGRETINVLKCSVCWEFYRDPIILGCGHTFCYGCLLEMGKHAKSNNIIRAPLHSINFGCPNCRRPIYINSLLARRVTHNYPLTSLIESLRQRKSWKSTQKVQVTRGTNTEPGEPTDLGSKGTTDCGSQGTKDFGSQQFAPGMDPKRKRHKQDTNERKFDLLTEDLDSLLRTLSAENTVLGDFSCAADIQQIARDHAERLARESRETCDAKQENKFQSFRNEHERFVRKAREAYDAKQENTFPSFKNEHEPKESTNNFRPCWDIPEFGPRKKEYRSRSSQTHSFDSLFKPAKKASSAFQDPAIVSFSIDSPAEKVSSFGLFSFPGFGRS